MAGSTEPRLVCLAALGGDERLFEPQRRAFPHLECLPWIEPLAGETLESFGRRMAEAYPLEGRYFLGGVSFGGMVALEMARYLEPQAVFLIGSCRSGSAVPWYLRMFEFLFRPVPMMILDPVFRFGINVRVRTIRDGDEAGKIFSEMVRETSLSFIRWGGRAVTGWNFDSDLNCPVFHIHGGGDRIIPLRLVHPDKVVPGAGHLVNLIFPEEVNKYLLEKMNSEKGRQHAHLQ